MKFLFLCVISLMSFDKALSQCNTCLATGRVACFSTTQYFSCINSVIDISTLKTCPTNQFCGDVATGCSAAAATVCTVAPQTTNSPVINCAAAGMVTK